VVLLYRIDTQYQDIGAQLERCRANHAPSHTHTTVTVHAQSRPSHPQAHPSRYAVAMMIIIIMRRRALFPSRTCRTGFADRHRQIDGREPGEATEEKGTARALFSCSNSGEGGRHACNPYWKDFAQELPIQPVRLEERSGRTMREREREGGAHFWMWSNRPRLLLTLDSIVGQPDLSCRLQTASSRLEKLCHAVHDA
jgi:hypothetical protein